MKRRLCITTGLALLFALTARDTSPSARAQQPARDDMRYEVTAAVSKFVDAANRGDANAVMAMFSDKPDVTVVADGEVYEGTGDIRSHTEQLLGRGSYVFQLGPMTIADLHGIAVAVGSYTLRAHGSAQAITARGAVSFVMERGPRKRWTVAHMHRSAAIEKAHID